MIDFIGNDIEKNTLYKNEIPYRMVCNMIKYAGFISTKKSYANMG